MVAFDPWERLPKIAQMTGVGDDAFETATFTIEEATPAWIYALGELSGPTSRYDYGWLEREGEGTVWEMDYDRTRNAGGASRNRVEEAYVELAPGTYTLSYRSDDSHSPDRWRGSEPYDPDRWGVTLVALERPPRDGSNWRGLVSCVLKNRLRERWRREAGRTTELATRPA